MIARQLPLRFDAARLAAEVGTAAGAATWETHFNPSYHNGGWSGIALRSNSRTALTLFIDPSRPEEFIDTPVLRASPYLDQVLATFACELRSVRLMRLEAGGVIHEHSDFDIGLAHEEVRLHVPVATNDGVDFRLDGRRVVMQPGECWYLDLSRPHSVRNGGATDRVHLVIDAVANDWLRELVSRDTTAPAARD